MTLKFIRKRMVYFFSIVTTCAFSQQIDEQLQSKYWTYKNRLHKYFIYYANQTQAVGGKGTPCYQHNIGKYGLQPLCTLGTTLSGHIKQGDAPEAIGMYMAALALEYRMLKDEGKDCRGTLNEIYYLIQSINRLDFDAEGYFSGNANDNALDGFMKRGDGDDNLRQTFTTEAANTLDPEDRLDCIASDGWDRNTGQIVVDEKNAMSKDHVSDMFLGFSFVKKYLYDAPIVQPTFADSPLNLVSEVVNITNRIMTFLTTDRVINLTENEFNNLYATNFTLNCPTTYKVTMNYVVYNPVLHKVVPRGNNFNILSYPLVNMAKKITGYSWETHPLHIKIDGSVCVTWPYQFDKSYGLASNSDEVGQAWGLTGSLLTNLIATDFQTPIPLCDQLLALHPGPNGPTICSDYLRDVSYSPTYQAYVVAYLLATFASQSGTWPQNYVVTLGDYYNMWQFDLQYALLNGTTPIHNSKAYWENILSGAPCDGPYNYKNSNNQTAFAHGWYTSNNWTHPSEPTFNAVTTDDRENEGDFPGIDYMFLYNMYRYYYKTQTTLPFALNNSCPCSQNPVILGNSQSGSLVNSVAINRKFSSYKNIGLYIKEYISQNLDINPNITLTNNTDLVICNNSTVRILGNAFLTNKLNAAADDSVRITVRKGSTLEVGGGGTLNVGKYTKVIIEDGATLILDPGASVDIHDNASVIIEHGGNLIVTAGPAITQIQLEGAHSLFDDQDVNTNVNLMTIGQQLVFNSGVALQGGLARFVGGIFEHGNSAKLIISNCRVLFDYTQASGTINPQSQMVYQYRRNADLQLPNHGILDLRGDLHLRQLFGGAPNFTFTWPGTVTQHGYVRFSRQGWWGGSSVPHIIADPGSTISFNGINRTDTILSVEQETVYILDPNIVKTTFSKGLVVFNANGARLEITTPYDIIKTTFRGFGRANTGGYQEERGLELYTNPQSGYFYDCDFISLGTALSLPLIFSNTNFTIKNCRFYDCGNGIRVWGGGLQASNCTFYGNYYPGQYFATNPLPGVRAGILGLNANGLTQNSTFYNCVANSQALASVNSSPVSCFFNSCTVKNAGFDNFAVLHHGIDVSQSNVSLYCCTFKHVDNSYYNYDYSNIPPIPHAVVEVYQNGLLDMSPQYHGGYNNFNTNASASIYLQRAFVPQLMFGNNNLMADYVNGCYSTSGNIGTYGSQGTVNPQTWS